MRTLPDGEVAPPSDEPALTPLRFAVVATLARGVVEAAVITFVLVGEARGVSPFRLGLLAAATSAPQVLTAPWLGARLDAAARPARVLAGLVAVIAAGVAVVGGGLGRWPFAAVVAVAVAWSVAEPAVMGGLSGVASRSAVGDGRIETADAASYGVAAIAGQGVVALVVALSSPPVVVIALAALGVVAAAMVARLPLVPAAPTTNAAAATSVRAGLRAIGADRDLLAVTVLTTISMSAFGGLALVAVELAEHHGRDAGSGSLLVLAMAIGAVPGALAARRLGATARPVGAAVVAVVVVGMAFALALGPWAVALIGFALAGFADGPLLAATFAVRTAGTPARLRASVYTIAAGVKIAGTAVGAVVIGTVVEGAAHAGVIALIGFQVVALAAALAVRIVRPAPA